MIIKIINKYKKYKKVLGSKKKGDIIKTKVKNKDKNGLIPANTG